MGQITFYDKNNCAGSVVLPCSDDCPQEFNCKETNACKNDAARSVKLQGVRAGRVIEVYDSPKASTADDWTRITVLRDMGENETECVGTFEQNLTNDTVRVEYFPHNGLDGKVSVIRIKCG